MLWADVSALKSVWIYIHKYKTRRQSIQCRAHIDYECRKKTVSPSVISDLYWHVGKLCGSYSSTVSVVLNPFIPCVCAFTYMYMYLSLSIIFMAELQPSVAVQSSAVVYHAWERVDILEYFRVYMDLGNQRATNVG